jgi:GDPmannose 4,6-dehydratase
MKKRAIITGGFGQDGSYLCEYLVSKNYDVYILKRNDVNDNDHKSMGSFNWDKNPNIHFISAHLMNQQSLKEMLNVAQPNEIYHLAAQTFVSYNPLAEFETLQTNILGTQNILSACFEMFPASRFFFASSAEIFGKTDVSPQNEQTPTNPKSVYGISKAASQQLVDYYRNEKSYFACSAILFNHESPRRGENFVTRKITRTAARIKLKLESYIELGNVDASRDWGYAPNYIEAMHLMLQQNSPENYVLSTGESKTVRNFLNAAFSCLDLDYNKYLKINQKFYRPLEKVLLVGDNSKAIKNLSWKPTKKFEDWVSEMVQFDLEKETLLAANQNTHSR